MEKDQTLEKKFRPHVNVQIEYTLQCSICGRGIGHADPYRLLESAQTAGFTVASNTVYCHRCDINRGHQS